jgi:hypothetical protein
MTEPSHPAGDLSVGRRVVVRRGVVLGALLAAVTAVVVVLGPAYLWPLFVFPLVVGAVFFFELGSLLVTAWLGFFFVNLFAFGETATPEAVRQAVIGNRPFGSPACCSARSATTTASRAGSPPRRSATT